MYIISLQYFRLISGLMIGCFTDSKGLLGSYVCPCSTICGHVLCECVHRVPVEWLSYLDHKFLLKSILSWFLITEASLDISFLICSHVMKLTTQITACGLGCICGGIRLFTPIYSCSKYHPPPRHWRYL